MSRGCRAQDLGGAEQLVELAHAQHARAPERGFIGGIAARQRARVRLRRLGAGRAAARLDDDDRLGSRGASRGRHELRRVGDRLHVQQDGAALRVAGQVVEQIAEIDVGHIAERDDVGEADVAAARPIDDARDQGSRLREEGDVAGQRRRTRSWRSSRCAAASGQRSWVLECAGCMGRAASSIACLRSSRMPAVMTTAARVPFAPSSSISAGSVGGGVTRTARSGARGSAATEG